MLDVGDTVTLTAPTVRDSSGSPANADTVVLTVTLPDGSTQTPTVTNPPAETGKYTHPYVIAQYGRHVYRFEFSGTAPDQAYVDIFNAADPAWPSLVGLSEVKEQLNYAADDTSDDEELRGFIASASEVANDLAGQIVRRTYTETYSGGERAILLRRRPVISVTSVTVDDVLVDAGDYTASETGILAHRWARWARGFRNVEVVYIAGREAVPASVIDGTRELIRINWRPQQGGNYSPFDGAGSDDFGVSRQTEGSLQGAIRLGFFVPNTVMQRLQPHVRGPHVA